MTHRLIKLTLLLSSILLLGAANPHAQELRILRVTPEGADVPAGQQIVIEFNRPVVPLGEMRRSAAELPITITPRLDCQWRWLNSSALACNLTPLTAMLPATAYSITIRPGITAEDSATIPATYQQTFTTERPKITTTWIKTWLTPGTPVLQLVTNLPVTQQTLQRYLVFVSANDKILSTARVEPDAVPSDEETEEDTDTDAHPLVYDQQHWLVTPQRQLPPATTVTLHLEPGLRSTLGAQPGLTDPEVITTTTFSAFTAVGITCQTNAGDDITIQIHTPQRADQSCNPLAPITLLFTAPVSRTQAQHHLRFTPALPGKNSNASWDIDDDTGITIEGGRDSDTTYSVWLPPMQAGQSYNISAISTPLTTWQRIRNTIPWLRQPVSSLTDAFGRPLAQPFQLHVAVDHRKPNFELPYHDAVLEKYSDSEVPLYVNNLTQISYHYRSVTPHGDTDNQTTTQSIPQVIDKQFAIPLGIRQLLAGSGAVYGAITTQPHVDKPDPEYRLLAQVTPFQLQLKLGHFNTLAWVTDLATGQPVSNARVSIYSGTLTDLSTPPTVSATALTDDHGIAILPGRATLDPDLSLNRGWNDNATILLARIDKGDDLALLPLTYDYVIDTWRASDGQVSDTTQPNYGHLSAWGMTAQGIYRAGDTIQYAFFVRDQNNQTLAPAPTTLAYTLQLIDPTGKVVDTVPDLHFSAFGSYSGSFTTAKTAAIGWYQFRLLATPATTQDTPTMTAWNGDNNNDPPPGTIVRTPMRVLVSDFTPASFSVSSELDGTLFHSDQSVTVNTQARLHAGGPYNAAQARVTAVLEQQPFTSTHPLAQGFHFNDPSGPDSATVFQTIAPLDRNGNLRSNFTLTSYPILYGTLRVESAVQDERGAYVAAQTQAHYTGVDRWVGLRSDQWVYHAQQPATIHALAVDAQGIPVADTTIDIDIEQQVTSVARIKDAGNAYTANYHSDWQIISHCHGKSQRDAPLACRFTPPSAGDYRATAHIHDHAGRTASAQIPLWVVGKQYVLWDEGSDNYLQILPEKSSYHVGDTARFIVKNPYPGAQALITVERYGVLDHFVQTFTDSAPVVSIPIKPDYLPGVYVSISVFSPRVAKPLESGQVDLGKPTFRIGYVVVPVTDPYKHIQVHAQTDQPSYRPGATVTVHIHAQADHPSNPAEPMQLTVAVVDEAVLALLTGGTRYYDPYSGFYKLDDLDLRNYSLLTRLVGRQKFEKKGANPGGDGGIGLGLRNFFTFVSYWNPAITTDAHGDATVHFVAPDNLTGWRVLALALTPSDRMGLGEATFTVNRPTELRPALPNQVNEGDRFIAQFSVLNRSNQTRTLTATLSASGDLATPVHRTTTIQLAPYQRSLITLPVQAGTVSASRTTSHGVITFRAEAGDSFDRDALQATVPVEKQRALETTASYGSTTAAQVTETLRFPSAIHTDTGGIDVRVYPSIIGGLSGAFRYMRDYPYTCWEQKLTKGVMAANYQQLAAYVPDVAWPDSANLPATTLSEAANFQAANGGMSYFTPQDAYADPYLSAYTALAFNWLRRDGQMIPTEVEQRLHAYLLNFLRRDSTNDDYSDGMTATVRAVALAALAEHGLVTLADLQRYLPYVPQMSLFGKAYFINAALQVKGAASLADDVARQILAQSNQSSGAFTFNESLDDGYARILASPLRDNCAVLTALTALAHTPSAQTQIGDIPVKLARSILQTRANRDHWENTQENIFCMSALIDYSRSYERTPPLMSVSAHLDDQLLGHTRFERLSDPAVTFSRPLQANDPGRNAQISIDRNGSGRLYYTTRLSYAPLAGFDTPTNAGIDVRREYRVQRNNAWVLLHNPMQIKRGDTVRVDIYVSVPTARNFVAISDPIPGGLEPINRNLATAVQLSTNTTEEPTNYNTWGFYHQELHNDAAQFYADYLPAGSYHLTYTAQAIAAGSFTVMPTTAEEMYNPDVYGRGVSAQMQVQD